jgi:hypothetical protein
MTSSLNALSKGHFHACLGTLDPYVTSEVMRLILGACLALLLRASIWTLSTASHLAVFDLRDLRGVIQLVHRFHIRTAIGLAWALIWLADCPSHSHLSLLGLSPPIFCRKVKPVSNRNKRINSIKKWQKPARGRVARVCEQYFWFSLPRSPQAARRQVPPRTHNRYPRTSTKQNPLSQDGDEEPSGPADHHASPVR